jgi:hypothetical protein
MSRTESAEPRHACPICGVALRAIPRYPRYVCKACAALAKDAAGRPLGFGNSDIAGGCEGVYSDTGETYDARLCYVAGRRCSVEEARFGGIVIQALDVPRRGPHDTRCAERGIELILAADWGVDARKRALWEARVDERVVRPVPGVDWTVQSVLEHTRRSLDRTLLVFDAPLGLPQSYLDAARTLPQWAGARTFMDWLRAAPLATFERTRDPRDWSLERPFFHVPKGGRTAYQEAAAHQGVDLRRTIERSTRGNPVFILSGIPGSVGSGALDLWRGLLDAELEGHGFDMWPFDGTGCAASPTAGRPTIGEMYPRALYASALLDDPAHRRSLLRVAKTKHETRAAALAALAGRPWLCELDVRIEGTRLALASEDHFDALLSAAGLLRSVLAGEPLHPSALPCAMSEGGIIGSGAVDLDLREQTFDTGRWRAA